MCISIRRLRSLGGLAFAVLLAACGNTEGLPPEEQDITGVRPDARDITQAEVGDEDTSEADDTNVTSEDDTNVTTATTDDDTSVTTIEDTTVAPPEDTTATTDDDTVEDTTVEPPEDTLIAETTVAPPEDTTVAPPEDTVAPEDTTTPPEDVVVVPPTPRHPMITEAMAKNDTVLADGFGEYSDWIEIYNPHDVPIDLEGYRLTDELPNRAKYVFPAHELAPHAYVIVWASDRTSPFPGELHAAWKLGSDGETLWIISPDDEVVDTFSYGRQLDDISVGRPFEIETTMLVGPGSEARYLTLDPGQAPPTNWAMMAYPDSSWAVGTPGFGHIAPVTLAPGPEPVPGFITDLGAATADSVAQWSTTGTQGANNWTYGYWLRSSDANGEYAASEFTQFPNNYFTGGAWDWPNGNPPWTYIGQTTSHPANNNGVEHWPIRRWTAPQAGTVVLAWTVRKTDTGGGGVSGHLYVDGTQLDTQTIGGSDQTGVTRVLSANVVAGSKIDLAHSPRGATGNGETSDSSALTLRAWYVVGDSFVETELDLPTGSGLAIRHAFDVDDLGAVGTLKLTLQTDDGAAVFLNSLPVAALNASPDPGGAAPVDRTAIEVGTPSVFRFPAIDGELVEGQNVLAVRAYDSAADDGAFAVNATLEGEAITVSDEIRYYTAPTPGEPNGASADTLAPIIGDVTENPFVRDADAIVVRATIIRTSAPIATAKMFWRTNFGSETEVNLLDNGSAPDQIANDGVYAAQIAASAAGPGDLVRWRIVATDTASRTSRWPEYLDPLDSDQYHGTVIDDPSIVSNLQVMHTFLQTPSAADTESGTRATVWFRGELYDNVRFDLHGQSTSGFPKKAYNVDFNGTQRFRWADQYPRMKDINLLTNWADKTKTRNTLAYMTIGATGSGYHLAEPVRVERNGEFHAIADMVEDGDDRWLERLGLDGEGALYKCYDSLNSVGSAEKKTRREEAKDDLQAVIDAMNQGDSSKSRWLWDNTDIPGMVSFAAQHTIISNHDCCHKNYYVYRDTNGTREWVMLPWDVDLSFGHRWTGSQQYFDENVYWDNGIWIGDGNKLLGALYDLADFRAMVVRRMRTLMDDFLQPPGTPEEFLWMEARMQEIADLIGADEALDRAKWGSWGNQDTMQEAIDELFVDFFPDRRDYLYNDVSEIPGAQPSNATLQIAAFDASLGEPTQAYIRINNPGTSAVDLSDARLSGEVLYNFRPGTVIPAGKDLYLVADVNAFRARTVSPKAGERLFVQGPWSGAIDANPSLTITSRLGFTMATR